MASASKIVIGKANTGLLRDKQTEVAAAKVSELVQKDMEKHHALYDLSTGFHNHLLHHLLTLYGTSASPTALAEAYDRGAPIQHPASSPDPTTVSHIAADLASARSYLGKGEHYVNFLSFYRSETERLGGWEQVLAHHVFDTTSKRAADLFLRLHFGLLHPLIQLSYGIEWTQPAVVAAALAQAAVHADSTKLGDFLISAEKMAREVGADTAGDSDGKSMPSITSLLAEIRSDTTLARAARFSDAQQIRDGVLARAGDAILRLAAKVQVGENELEERMAEMYDAALWFTLGSAGAMEGKVDKIDFYFLHHVTSCPFYVSLIDLPFITRATKCRMLEWKIRLDLIQYAARGAPLLTTDAILRRGVISLTAEEAFQRLQVLPDDDGHVIKLARAIEIFRRWLAETAVGGKEIHPAHFTGPGDWGKALGLVVESTGPGQKVKWVRGVGMPEAWKDILDKSPQGTETLKA